jgi:hypothetical protein
LPPKGCPIVLTRSGLRSEFQVLTGSLDRLQKLMGCNWIFDWVLLGHTGFFFSYFFFNSIRFQPRISRVPSRPVKPGFKIMMPLFIQFSNIGPLNVFTRPLNISFILTYALIFYGKNNGFNKQNFSISLYSTKLSFGTSCVLWENMNWH